MSLLFFIVNCDQEMDVPVYMDLSGLSQKHQNEDYK